MTEDLQDAFIELEGDPPTPPAAKSDATTTVKEALPQPTVSSGNEDPVVESTSPANVPATAHITRRFEFTGGISNKFWEITLAGTQHTVRFGRIGTRGQTVTKTFEDATMARRDCDRLIRSKVAKGYQEK